MAQPQASSWQTSTLFYLNGAINASACMSDIIIYMCRKKETETISFCMNKPSQSSSCSSNLQFPLIERTTNCKFQDDHTSYLTNSSIHACNPLWSSYSNTWTLTHTQLSLASTPFSAQPVHGSPSAVCWSGP